MLLDHVGVSSWQSLDINEILLMSLLIDPRILDHNWLGSESRLFLLREKGRHTSLLGFGAELVISLPHQLGGGSHPLPWVRGLSYGELLNRLSLGPGFLQDFILHLLILAADVLEVWNCEFLNRTYMAAKKFKLEHIMHLRKMERFESASRNYL